VVGGAAVLGGCGAEEDEAGKKNGFWIQNSELGGAWARVCGGEADQSFQSTG
jgi:hypothetical protein